jgi:hypothetical protein
MPYVLTVEEAERRFRRILRNLESFYYRQDHGGNVRNRPPDPVGYIMRCRELFQECDALYDVLDQDEKLAARYNRAERRAFGCAP